MEVQQLGLGLAAAVPWKNKKVSADDNLVPALHRGGTGGGISCFEADKKKKNVVAHKHKRSSEEALGLIGEYNNDQDDNTDLSTSSSLLLVWCGQPNEDDDDNRPKKRQMPSCTTFAVNKDIDGEGLRSRVVGWPPVESFRTKLLYGGQHHGPHQQPEINIAARLARNRENGRSNKLMIPLSSGKIFSNTRRGGKQCKINPNLP